MALRVFGAVWMGLAMIACDSPTKPEGAVIPLGDYVTWAYLGADSWEVPRNSSVSAGPCATLTSALMLASAGTPQVTNVLRVQHVDDGHLHIYSYNLHAEQRPGPEPSQTVLDYGTWEDTVTAVVEQTAPRVTALYVNQFFPGNAVCPSRRIPLLYMSYTYQGP